MVHKISQGFDLAQYLLRSPISLHLVADEDGGVNNNFLGLRLRGAREIFRASHSGGQGRELAFSLSASTGPFVPGWHCGIATVPGIRGIAKDSVW